MRFRHLICHSSFALDKLNDLSQPVFSSTKQNPPHGVLWGLVNGNRKSPYQSTSTNTSSVVPTTGVGGWGGSALVSQPRRIWHLARPLGNIAASGSSDVYGLLFQDSLGTSPSLGPWGATLDASSLLAQSSLRSSLMLFQIFLPQWLPRKRGNRRRLLSKARRKGAQEERFTAKEEEDRKTWSVMQRYAGFYFQYHIT